MMQTIPLTNKQAAGIRSRARARMVAMLEESTYVAAIVDGTDLNVVGGTPYKMIEEGGHSVLQVEVAEPIDGAKTEVPDAG